MDANFYYPETWGTIKVLVAIRENPLELGMTKISICPRCKAFVAKPEEHREWHIKLKYENE